MKLLLIGYPGSNGIRKASDYLINKYMPGFDSHHLSYKGGLYGWSAYIIKYLKTLDDKYLVMALDDYLLNASLDKELFEHLLKGMNETSVCAKLCDCTIAENEEYPVTTQYCIWNREYLISLLERTTSPWDFEISGSQFFKQDNKTLLWGPALSYNTNSSLSKRWDGVDLRGLGEKDIKTIQQWI